ncbi:3-phosphoglycerate dehydrogenase [Peptostreptococcus russellii]|uniref:NAD(P)-dependent oxidoreductase n=1 Tax=Peptostreptococcus russellii TaxID=215200 RepID=UPI0016232AC3|nr:NAD(P)-dependent oxidoreductase [Peptostreptococcus russellii]MBC2578391.1 3-phosphoglycerate dehydrogenase [Peptostreptococcus russellii]
MKKILATDGIDKEAVEMLRKKGFEVEEKFYPEEELKDKIKEIDIIIVRSATKIRKEIIDEALKTKNLKMIIRAGVGLDNIDVNYARENGIVVRNTPSASSNAVAELVLCEMLVLARNVKIANLKLGEGIWDKKNLKGTEIYGKTIGIIGFGNIARKLAQKAHNLGMKVMYNDIAEYENEGKDYKFANFDEIIENADYITVHTPLTEKTKYMFNKDVFKRMKNTAFLINCARGGIVNEKDLLEALNQNQIAGAAIDCFENEPRPLEDIVNHPRVTVTPHIGASTNEAQKRIAYEIVDIVSDYYDCLLEGAAGC